MIPQCKKDAELPIPFKSVSGEVLTLTECGAMPLKKLKRIDGKSTQDGTPTPITPVPIHSVGDEGIKIKQGPIEKYYTIQAEPLRSLPNGTKDTLEADGIHRRVGSVILNGSENWNSASSSIYPFRLIIPNAKFGIYQSQIINAISDYYESFSWNEGISIMPNYSISSPLSTSYNILAVRDIRYTNLNDFKTWLSQNPVTIIYELEEEVIEPFKYEQQAVIDSIKLKEGDNTLSVDNTEMEVEYWTWYKGEQGEKNSTDTFNPIYIKENTDLDNITTPGMYYNSSNVKVETMANVPIAKAFSLLVERHAGTKQTFTIFDTNRPDTWIRNKYDNTWGEWHHVSISKISTEFTLVGKVLYNNSEGTNGTVTLSESASNFTYVDIFCKTDNNCHFSVRITNPNDKVAILTATYPNYDPTAYLKSKLVAISFGNIVNSSGRYTETKLTNAVSTSNANNIYIYKVVGYR